jgi:hypothetical protein
MSSVLRPRWRRLATLATGVAACVAVGSVVIAGFAAGLGVLNSGSIGSWSESQTANSPTVISCDDFTGADGALSGRSVADPTACGSYAWTTHVGTWSVISDEAAADGTSGANATLDVSVINATVHATISGLVASRDGGLVLNHDGASTFLAAALLAGGGGTVELRLVDLGVGTTLASAALALTAADELSLTRDGSAVTVRVNGVTMISHTLTGGESATLGTGGRAGLYASNSNVLFDDLRVTTPE